MNEFLGALKALADESRLNIISLLLTHDFCVGMLAKRLDISEAAVSQHLQVLRKTGVVKGEKRGYYTHYCVDREMLRKVAEKIMDMSAQTPVCKGSKCHHTPGGHQCKKQKEE
ncbi:MAG: metalloregulator ArsR/SmtB family transcription factor [Dehalobacterium sp.]